MKEGPDFAYIASLIGDPARANILSALLSGKALTATELSVEAGLTRQTTSSHLGQLLNGGLITVRRQGRHRYFQLASADVVHALEALSVLTVSSTGRKVRTGPRDSAMRKARVCYDHLAGEMGVLLFDRLVELDWLKVGADGLDLTVKGEQSLKEQGVPLDHLKTKRRPLCRSCLDWSERRQHLAGSLGAALLDQITNRNWARREQGSRIVTFSPEGEMQLRKWLEHA